MTKAELTKQIESLELLNTELVAEIASVDKLMRDIGFTDGLATIKATAEEMHAHQDEYFEDDAN